MASFQVNLRQPIRSRNPIYHKENAAGSALQTYSKGIEQSIGVALSSQQLKKMHADISTQQNPNLKIRLVFCKCST